MSVCISMVVDISMEVGQTGYSGMPVQYIRIDYGVSIFQEFVVFRVTKTSQFSQANLWMLNLSQTVSSRRT